MCSVFHRRAPVEGAGDRAPQEGIASREWGQDPATVPTGARLGRVPPEEDGRGGV